MKTPEEIAVEICSEWYPNDLGRHLVTVDRQALIGRITAAIREERMRMDSTLEIWRHKVALLTDERNSLRADLAVARETLKWIIDLDQVQRTEVVSVDASGATHSVTWVDGRCARLARAMLDRLGKTAQEYRDAVHG